MSLSKLVLALTAAAGMAGCSSGPGWEEPKSRKPLIIETEQPKETPSKPKNGNSVTVELSYNLGNDVAAEAFNGYVQLIQKTEGRSLTDYQILDLALRIDKDENGISTKEISDHLKAYCKSKGIEPRLPYVKADIKLKYSEDILVTEDARKELEAIQEKDDAYKARFVQRLHAVYDGETPLGKAEVKKLLK